MARVVTGLATILGRLARFFRLAPYGAAEPGTAAPSRPRLPTVEAIVDELRARRELPTPAEGQKWSWSYKCFYVDATTGQSIGRGVYHVVETDVGADYRTAAAAARRATLYPDPSTLSPPAITSANVKLKCTRVKDPITIPTS